MKLLWPDSAPALALSPATATAPAITPRRTVKGKGGGWRDNDGVSVFGLGKRTALKDGVGNGALPVNTPPCFSSQPEYSTGCSIVFTSLSRHIQNLILPKKIPLPPPSPSQTMSSWDAAGPGEGATQAEWSTW